MAETTLDQVIAVDKEITEMKREADDQILALHNEKQVTFATMDQENDASLKKHQEAIMETIANDLEAFKTQQRAESASSLAQLESRFKDQKDELVQNIVEEVLNIYGNR